MSTTGAAVEDETDERLRGKALLAAVGAYCAQHPVFRTSELDSALGVVGEAAQLRRRRMLAHCVERGFLVQLSRNAFATVESADFAAPVGARRRLADQYAVAAGMLPDSILAYRSALELYGIVPGRNRTVVYLARSGSPSRHKVWGDVRGYGVAAPVTLQRDGFWLFETQVVYRAATGIRVTTRERTLVDVLDRPRLVGSWTESVAAVVRLAGGPIDWEAVVRYMAELRHTTTAMRVAVLLERHAASYGITDAALAAMEAMRPQGTVYWDRGVHNRGVTDNTYCARWRLVVPRAIIDASDSTASLVFGTAPSRVARRVAF